VGGAALSDALAAVDEAALAGLLPAARRLAPGALAVAPGEWTDTTRAGAGYEFRDFVPHAPGGDARRIDWRASARSGELMERRRHAAGVSRWCVCLDASGSMGPRGTPRHLLALQIAAAMAYLLLHLGHEVGLLQIADKVTGDLPAARGREQYSRVVQGLHRHSPRGGPLRLEAAAGRLRAGEGVLLVSDFLAVDGLAGALLALRRRGHPLRGIAVRPGAQEWPAQTGAALLQDAESGECLVVANPREAARAAAAVLHRQRLSLQALCLRQGIVLSWARSDEGWSAAVLAHVCEPATGAPRHR
jgi:uncharacterized protein (DUF58 family)